MTKKCLIICSTILIISVIAYFVMERLEWLCITCNNEWGLASAEFEQNITLSNDTTMIFFSFIPRLSSTRYELRVFSPENKENEVENDSIERLLSYHIRIMDINKKVIYERNGNRTLSYTSQAPSFVWLISNIYLKKNNKYFIDLTLLSPYVQKDNQQDVILVLGIGPRISLFN